MSPANGRAKRSEKGLLTPDNCVVALIDHQPQMALAPADLDRSTNKWATPRSESRRLVMEGVFCHFAFL